MPGHRNKSFQTLNYVMKIIWRKSMSTIYIFVGQQVCKQAHTHFVHSTVLIKPVPDCSSFRINSSSISRLPSTMSLRTVALRNVSTTQLFRYYRGKSKSYRGENLYRYIANDKILPIPIVYTHCQHTFQFKQLVKVHVALDDPFKQIHVFFAFY